MGTQLLVSRVNPWISGPLTQTALDARCCKCSCGGSTPILPIYDGWL